MRASSILTPIGAFLILLFTAGPLVLAIGGSVIPDRVMFASDRGLFDEVTLENYRFVFTGEVPPAYLKSGANRTMISDAARQAPLSLWNSAQIALAALVINIVLGTPAAFLYGRYLFRGRRLSFMFLSLSPLVLTIALISPIYMMF
jgi:ABC-type glycerol-3-phosphate transport system permease component